MISIQLTEEKLKEIISSLIGVELQCYEWEGDDNATYTSHLTLTEILHPKLLESIQEVLDEDDIYVQSTEEGKDPEINPKYMDKFISLINS